MLWLANAKRYAGQLVLLGVIAAAQATAQALPGDIGSIYTSPNGYLWTDVGAALNTPEFFQHNILAPQTIRAVNARFHVFRPSDDYRWSWFPYSALKAYESQEAAAGQAPLFVTATYQGRKRPVLWAWSLGLQGANSGSPTTPASEWEYAVNVADDRFINFWINQYVRSVLLRNLGNQPNIWIGLDECAFYYGLYGVLDDNNNFVAGIKWDPPFAQTEAEYFNSIRTFFLRVKQLAPELNLMPNSGGLADWSQFWSIYGAAPGFYEEEINHSSNASQPSLSVWTRNFQLTMMNAYAYASSQGQRMILQSWMPAGDATWIRSSHVTYLLLKGANTFYAPSMAGTVTALPVSAYSAAATRLGNPTGPMQTQQFGGSGFVLYSREYQGGLVYSNWSGQTQTVRLPAGRTWVDVNGNAVNQVTLPDLTGTYVFASGGGSTGTGSGSTVYLSDLSPVLATSGWGPVEKDSSNGEAAAGDGHTISINGVTYAKGLGVHAPSKLDYILTGRTCTTFTSDVGVDDEWAPRGSVVFQVFLDGALQFDSGLMTGWMPARTVNVNVSGKSVLTLVVNDGRDGINYDHADWANARLTCQ